MRICRDTGPVDSAGPLHTVSAMMVIVSGRLSRVHAGLLAVVALVVPAVLMGGLDPAGGMAVLLLAVVAAIAAVGMRLPHPGPVRPVTGPSHRRPHEIRPLRVTDPDAAGRGPRPRAPGVVVTAPAR